MVTLAIAYIIAWTAVVAYLGWLAVQQQRLSARIAALEERQSRPHRSDRPASKAA
jgi:CcmD family protein